MDIKDIYNGYLKSRVISTDSRNITPGCIFFALKGENFNGNRFAADAIALGASLAVVDEDPEISDRRIIKVENVLQTLMQLATYHRKQLGIPVLAITGSNGKTTTKELCWAVLSKKFRVQATQGNLNNHIGVPVTLLSLKDDCEFAIIEMGANHHGEIDTLCNIALPDYGLITNIGKAHLEGFGSIEGVAKAKGELIRYLMAHSKTIFLNAGNKWLAPQVPGDYPYVRRYNEPDGLRAAGLSCEPYLTFNLVNGVNKLIKTKLAGAYNTENVLAACAAGLHFGISIDDIADAIAGYEPKNNRSQIIKTERNSVFMDAYNANPSSMNAAINEFLNSGNSEKMLILGEMREVGADSASEHAEIIRLLKQKGCSKVYCIGNDFQRPAAEAGYIHFQTVDQLIGLFASQPPSGYYILVKGSRSNRLERVLEWL